jgi:hypothetical protein
LFFFHFCPLIIQLVRGFLFKVLKKVKICFIFKPFLFSEVYSIYCLTKNIETMNKRLVLTTGRMYQGLLNRPLIELKKEARGLHIPLSLHYNKPDLAKAMILSEATAIIEEVNEQPDQHQIKDVRAKLKKNGLGLRGVFKTALETGVKPSWIMRIKTKAMTY